MHWGLFSRWSQVSKFFQYWAIQAFTNKGTRGLGRHSNTKSEVEKRHIGNTTVYLISHTVPTHTSTIDRGFQHAFHTAGHSDDYGAGNRHFRSYSHLGFQH
ncbi:unnamed protein product [Ectocarpus sp. 13 AM-2016]